MIKKFKPSEYKAFDSRMHYRADKLAEVENIKFPAVIGIDPGKKGAMCCLSYPNLYFYNFRCPVSANIELIALKRNFDVKFAILEKVWIRGDEKNVKTAEVLIRNSAMWATILEINRIPFIQAAPQTWRKGLVKSKGKKASIAKAKKLFPCDAELITSHDRAESALIAYRAYKHIEAGRLVEL